ncbi:MAG TPA: hypothetical protein VG146_02195 [Verrucomicrobiae bacterium]|nr:hypothetical protein [Verrucomicrobiae bacterium]
MNRAFKAVAYLVLALCVAGFGYYFGHEHSRVVHETPGASRSEMMAFLGAFLLALILLGCLCAYDLSHFFGGRAEQWFLQGGRPVEPGPELDEAERIRKEGNPLGAIQVLRDYLQQHPDGLHAMSRIAEIYKNDLENYLAAALEYEELLKHKPPAEQAAWTALHLAKLYGRLNEPEKSMALLERIEKDFGQTVAARRARAARNQLRAMGDEPEPET